MFVAIKKNKAVNNAEKIKNGTFFKDKQEVEELKKQIQEYKTQETYTPTKRM
ncbi:hypothetical protein HpCOL22_14990 [Helicobacter pylori]